MSDIKFACPHCQQHIQCEPGDAGMQIACPACSGSMVVPGQASAPVPAPAPVRVSGLPPGVAAAPPPPAGNVCPGCGTPMTRGAVMCTRCGYNLATGQRVQARTGVGAAAVAARKAAPASDKWYSNPNIWLGILLLFFGGLYAVARMSGWGMMVFAVPAYLFFFGARIAVLVCAFKEGAGTGFLALCVPVYDLYFVNKIYDGPMLKVIYTVALLAAFTAIFFA
jgi:hypothetical protein